MKVRIDLSQSVIDIVQLKCKVRILTKDDIQTEIIRIEEYLKVVGISETNWQGTTIRILPEKVCNSYGHAAMGTFAKIIRGQKDWFLVEFCRSYCDHCAGGGFGQTKVQLGEKAIAFISKELDF